MTKTYCDLCGEVKTPKSDFTAQNFTKSGEAFFVGFKTTYLGSGGSAVEGPDVCTKCLLPILKQFIQDEEKTS